MTADAWMDEFVEAASVSRSGSHASGTIDRANALLDQHPGLAGASIYAAAVSGDDEAIRRFIGADPASATTKGGPRGWDPLTYLCFSKYLRLDPARSDGFVLAATALLDAGADPNTGWFEPSHQPTPSFESAIYGAAGIAHHERLTRLLLERGADPNDGETPYHTPETYDNGALSALVESGKLNADSVATLLLRKADWHDGDGIDYLLANGADPNRATIWGHATALHQAIRRDNGLDILEALLDAGADPALPCDDGSAVAMAARRGRADFLRALERRRMPAQLDGVDRLIAACALGHTTLARTVAAADPELATELVAHGGRLLAEFAGNANTAGVAALLELGVPVTALFAQGDGYWDVARDSTALHVAAWRAAHDTVALLIDRGADVNARDARGRTPLMLAVKATVDSYWTGRRSPASVKALLAAGASRDGLVLPSGYDEADTLLQV